MSAYNKVIVKLEQQLLEQEQQLNQGLQKRRRLRARHLAVELALRQCAALESLAAALGGSCVAASTGPCSDDVDMCGAQASLQSAMHGLHGFLRGPQSSMADCWPPDASQECTSDANGGSSAGSANRDQPRGKPGARLGWSPAAAAARAAASPAAGELTDEGLHGALRGFAHLSCALLLRMRGGAPGAEESWLRLEREHVSGRSCAQQHEITSPSARPAVVTQRGYPTWRPRHDMRR
jgi:hypothetical protein